MRKIELRAGLQNGLRVAVMKICHRLQYIRQQIFVIHSHIAQSHNTEPVANIAKQTAAIESIVLCAIRVLQDIQPAFRKRLPAPLVDMGDPCILNPLLRELQPGQIVLLPRSTIGQQMRNLGRNTAGARLHTLNHPVTVAYFL